MSGKAMARLVPVVLALVVGVSAAMWPSLKFRDLTGGDFASRFAAIMFFALLIERTVEILMSIWRSAEANRREARVQALVAAGKAADDPALLEARTELVDYRAQTLQWTMPVAFAFGLVVAAFGVRVLSQFVDPASAGTNVPHAQTWWFNMSDIVFTGALLAGGADPIHKLLDVYRKFMEASAAKASGTKH